MQNIQRKPITRGPDRYGSAQRRKMIKGRSPWPTRVRSPSHFITFLSERVTQNRESSSEVCQSCTSRERAKQMADWHKRSTVEVIRENRFKCLKHTSQGRKAVPLRRGTLLSEKKTHRCDSTVKLNNKTFLHVSSDCLHQEESSREGRDV